MARTCACAEISPARRMIATSPASLNSRISSRIVRTSSAADGGHAGAALHAHGVEPAAHLQVRLGRGGQRIGHLGAIGQQRAGAGRRFPPPSAPRPGRTRQRRLPGHGGSYPRSRAPRACGRQNRMRAGPRRRRPGAGHQHQHGLGLGEAGQVIEIAVVTVGIVAVTVCAWPRALGTMARRRRRRADVAARGRGGRGRRQAGRSRVRSMEWVARWRGGNECRF